MSGPPASHLIHLPGGNWALWRLLVLRSAGFAADRPLELAVEGLGRDVERLLDLQDRTAQLRKEAVRTVNEELDALREAGAWDDRDRRRPLLKALRSLTRGKLPPAAWESRHPELIESIRCAEADLRAQRCTLDDVFREAQADASRKLQEVARWDLFREAVTWQNRHAARTALDALDRLPDPGASRGSQQRQHEELVASYLQRYCVKNDTIGFFGPVAWASLADSEPAVEVRFGRPPLEQREVYFENWAIDALARRLARRPGCRTWLIPRLRSSLWVDGDRVHRVVGPPLHLSPMDARLVEVCNGERTARQVVAELLADPALDGTTPEDVHRRLTALVKKRVLTWGLDLPLELHPERTLRRLLERIGDDALREEALAALDELEEARARVAAAASDPRDLDASLGELEETFSRLTGQSARRLHGQTYAGRGLVYEDCRRALDVRFGTLFLDRLGPPLTAGLQAARWLAGEVAHQLRGHLLKTWSQLRGDGDDTAIDSATFYARVMTDLSTHPDGGGLFAGAEAEYQRRWAEVLDIDPEAEPRRVHRTSEEVAARVDRLFGDVGPAWQLTRHFSPDVMIAAPDLQSACDGDFLAVLGEVHTGNTIFSSCFVSQHPDPPALYDLLRRDVVQYPVIVPFFIKENWMQRINLSLQVPEFHRYELTDAPPGSEPSCSLLPAGSVVVERNLDGLVARTRDGTLRFDPVELFCGALNQIVSAMIGRLLPPDRHLPRVQVGSLVVARERWSFGLDELELATESDPLERFVAVRRWARHHGIPRFSFFRVSSERKPFYLDLDSPIYVDLFAKMIRDLSRDQPGTGTVGVSEMLPRVDQVWLTDDDGRRYTCELRMVGLDRSEADRAARSAPAYPGASRCS